MILPEVWEKHADSDLEDNFWTLHDPTQSLFKGMKIELMASESS